MHYAPVVVSYDPKPVACRRAGSVEVRSCPDASVCHDNGILEIGLCELAVCGLRRMLWRGQRTLVLYNQALSFQHGLSACFVELRVRHDSGDCVLS